jgi:hypothetical protein
MALQADKQRVSYYKNIKIIVININILIAAILSNIFFIY